MARTLGRPEIAIALIDGPVETSHPDLAHLHKAQQPQPSPTRCHSPASAACRHGTFVAGILAGRRGSAAPAIAPGCTLMLHPLFREDDDASGGTPSATPDALAQAVSACVSAGARVINVSAALVAASGRELRSLVAALDHAARKGTLIVAAAGNQATVGGSAITTHPDVIPVIGCDGSGRPMAESTLGASIGSRGLAAPGEGIISLEPGGGAVTMAGSSAAAPFVAGAIALLWSEYPRASARLLRAAITRIGPRRSIVPPLLDAEAAWRAMRE
ncbi:S8 family serine peptidase [Elioraea sp.]|uniref:S8 family serine peptidase n=1 Tax=Elioraea sp. TaxID=2185103 RepID=UPI0025BF92D6|nr:S8 family serine peptidase [Elioraea sp.]